ncbi:uncharacterized protein LOC124439071 isoform X2 [Xenia sp. Carnegie-2017]|uniref:uncharacterized protein LOC124439071 isoform X2 n=1 Tax=Xenia sp. Carnegie-2017 TaxID=2897299 RepID=UPI001F03F65A|nr:uncharacterized protein LOC124439071 isoform X2 [Xenia sp. Carnegie-2017]
MDFILNKRLGSESGYDDLKSCQREARISGISSFIIGSMATYAVLKVTKILKKEPKYIPLICLGFGACCGYAKSIVVMQSYQNRLYQYEAQRTTDN